MIRTNEINFLSGNRVRVQIVNGEPFSIEWDRPPGAREEMELLHRGGVIERYVLDQLLKPEAAA